MSDSPPTSMTRRVSATIAAQLSGAQRLELQVALPELAGLQVEERLEVLLDGKPFEPIEVVGEHGNRIHLLDGVDGSLQVSYSATAVGHADPVPLTERDHIVYTRPSRYAESDRLLGFAAKQFGASRSNPAALLHEVTTWVGSHLSYVPGSSGPTDGATDTLMTGAGVCRDYAHLVISLMRAMDVPARLVAVYAPGCDPMDFHAVTEVAVDGAWQAADATLLAPRQSLLRICTGRDAADTAFLTNFGGGLVLESSVVTAVVDGELPVDDPSTDVALG